MKKQLQNFNYHIQKSGYVLLLLMFLSVLSLQAQTFIGGRTDFRDETIYFAMTTRFYDGDQSNNVQCWDGKQYNQGDPAWRGDFKGIIEKLDYIKALGFTAIWITPIVENASGYDYHGYHAMDFKKVDPRYESEDVKFKDLIDAVHAKDMKIILDVVFNHTGNFGEEYLCPMFEKDYSADLSNINKSLKKHPNTKLPANYDDLNDDSQYQARLALMKNTDGQNHDTNNNWHHFGHGNWDDLTCQWMQIAGDCVDLNTENPLVYNYIVQAYSQFIRMGVDGFRIDTGRHISRLVFNKIFNDAFKAVGREMNKDFFMFGEICTRFSTHWYRNTPAISTPFYTWKESKEYAWSDDPSEFVGKAIFADTPFSATNQLSCIQQYNDNGGGTEHLQPTSQNAKMQGNDYHTPNHSMKSGMDVIDFPMHWNFKTAQGAFRTAIEGDETYNDATYNVVYVDSHDYAPDHAPEDKRFAEPQDVWAENLSLMYTFRGIPCLYYGSEIEFKKGFTIDKGPNIPLRESGRAYYGDYITGDIQVNDFANYSSANGNVAVTLKHPLALHIQRLSKIRMAIPALRKGQYSTEGVSGNMAFKRRYTDSTTDSYVCVAISENATFSNILNGTYVDAITGDTKTVSNNSMTINVSGKGNIRVYVLNTDKTKAPGKVGEDGLYLYGSSPVNVNQGSYPNPTEVLLPDDGEEEEEEEEDGEIKFVEGEQAIFFEIDNSTWGTNIYTYIYHEVTGSIVKVTGEWPGQKMSSSGKKTVYKYVLTGEINNWKVLFSGNNNQQAPSSIGFDVVNGGYYTVNGYKETLTPRAVTGLGNTEADLWNIKIYYKDNVVYIDSPVNKLINIISVDGRIVRRMEIFEGQNTVTGIDKGLYIIDGKKVIL